MSYTYEWCCQKCGAMNGVTKDSEECPWCGGSVAKKRRPKAIEPVKPLVRDMAYADWGNIVGTLSDRQKRERLEEYQRIMGRLRKEPQTIKCGRCAVEILPHEILTHVCKENK